MSDLLRKEVLKAFRNLHKVRKIIFDGDSKALTASRDKINEEFKNQKNEHDPKIIENLIQYANEVAKELRTTVVQAKEMEPGVYELKITADTKRLDHSPYDPNVVIPRKARKKGKNQPCCQEK